MYATILTTSFDTVIPIISRIIAINVEIPFLLSSSDFDIFYDMRHLLNSEKSLNIMCRNGQQWEIKRDGKYEVRDKRLI